MNYLLDYCNANFLTLNPVKCEHLRLTLKKVYNLNNYVINNTEISEVQFHKHIGVWYDAKLTFNNHCDFIVSKALKKFNLLRVICKYVNGSTFLNLYKTYILPILEYSNLSWFPNKTQSKRLEIVQKKITNFICFKLGKNDLHYYQRLNKLNLQRLSSRRKIQYLKILYGIRFKTNLVPSDWSDDFQFYMSKNNVPQLIRGNISRIKLTDRCFSNYIIKIFNNLPKDIRKEQHYGTFVRMLNNHFK